MSRKNGLCRSALSAANEASLYPESELTADVPTGLNSGADGALLSLGELVVMRPRLANMARDEYFLRVSSMLMPPALSCCHQPLRPRLYYRQMVLRVRQYQFLQDRKSVV